MHVLPDFAPLLARFADAPDIHARLAATEALAGRRLASGEAAEVWLTALRHVAEQMDAARMTQLLRQFLWLAPNHPKAHAFYNLLMGQPTQQAPHEAVFLITSCVKYLDKAQALWRALGERGAHARIAIGVPTLTQAEDDGPLLKLPVPDSYEALTSKVLEGLAAVRQRYGAVSVIKVDDDTRIDPSFDPAGLAERARLFGYAGQAIGGNVPDRCWHMGKTTVPLPLYTRRRHARFAFGPLYLLGPRAVEHLVREWLFYPGEFDGEWYEDSAIGHALLRAGMPVVPLDMAGLGVEISHAHRMAD